MHKHRDVIKKYAEEILGTVNDGIYITDCHGITLFINAAYEEISGLKAEELCGKNVHHLKDDGIFNTILNPQIVETGLPATVVQELTNNKRVVLRGTPIFVEGQVALVITFVRDVTRITQLYDQMREQSELIRDYHDKISFISNDTRNTETNLDLFQSQAMQKLLHTLEKISATDASLLLLGETGTGKDVLARLAHSMSIRKNKMFLKVDCGSISENLIESELFGYVSGAFSGAKQKGKPGYFEVADGGTVMLDEIGELPLAMQTRFLRVLQDQEIMRVGASSPQKVNVRIIAATNKNLEDAIAAGTFRSDLYYRLNVAVLKVPPLRERIQDIRPFLSYFLKKYMLKYSYETTFSEESLHVLEAYSWPGNVRELQNLVQSLVITKDMPIIYPDHLPPHIHPTPHSADREHASIPDTSHVNVAGTADTGAERIKLPAESLPFSTYMASVEEHILRTALEQFGSVHKTAAFFQMNRSTIFRKLQKIEKTDLL